MVAVALQRWVGPKKMKTKKTVRKGGRQGEGRRKSNGGPNLTDNEPSLLPKRKTSQVGVRPAELREVTPMSSPPHGRAQEPEGLPSARSPGSSPGRREARTIPFVKQTLEARRLYNGDGATNSG